MHASLVLATHVQVIEENSQRFLQDMNAKEIALTLKVLGFIPESIEYHIQHSTCRDHANGHLLTYLMKDAAEEQMQGIFKIASATGYGKMSEFSAAILQKLLPGLYRICCM